MSITRTNTEEFATFVRTMEQDADAKKDAAYERKDTKEHHYWQGRADACRVVALSIPDFMYLQDERLFSLKYERAKSLETYLDQLTNERPDDRVLWLLWHDTWAFVNNVEFELGIRKHPTFAELAKASRAIQMREE